MVGQLAEAAPDGIDVYFDNVGGEAIKNTTNIITRGLTVKGFTSV